MRDFREYRGYVIEKVTAKDWFVTTPEGRMVWDERGRVPLTLKSAKATVDRDIRVKEFAASMCDELRVEISECGLEHDEIVEAVRIKHGSEWRFSRTEMALDSCVMMVFERA